MLKSNLFNIELNKALAALFIAFQKAGHINDSNRAKLFYLLFVDFKLLVKPENIDIALAELAETGFYTDPDLTIQYETAAIPPAEGYPATFYGTHPTFFDPNLIGIYDYPVSEFPLNLNLIEQPDSDLIDLIKPDDDPFKIIKKIHPIEPLNKPKLIDKDPLRKPENIINPIFADKEPEVILPEFNSDRIADQLDLRDMFYTVFIYGFSEGIKRKIGEFKDLIVQALRHDADVKTLTQFVNDVFAS